MLRLFQKKLFPQAAYFKHPVSIGLLAFFISFLLAFARSLNKDDTDFDVLKMALLLFVFFLMLVMHAKKYDPFPVIAKCMAVSSFLFLAIAILQMKNEYEHDLKTGVPFIIDYTIYSSHANKNTFAECLVIQLPALAFGMLYLKKGWRWLCISALVVSLAMVILLKSSGALLAFGIAAAAAVLVYFLTAATKKSTLLKYAMLLLIIVPAVVVYTNKPLKSKAELTGRFLFGNPDSVIGSTLKENSVYERLILWKSAIAMIKENPVAGKGLGNWKILFPKYHPYDARYLMYDTTRFTRTHCDYLSVWCEMGLIGITTFLFLLFYGLYSAFKITRNATDQKERVKGIIIFSGILMFAVIALTGFPLERIYNVMLLLIYLYLAVIPGSKKEPVPAAPKNNWAWALSFLTIILISGYAVSYAAKRMEAEEHLRNVINRQIKGDYPLMLKEAMKIDERHFLMDYTATPITWYKASALFLNHDVNGALGYYKKAVEENPNHVQIITDIGTCYDQLNRKEEARAQYHRALNINPYFPDALLNLAAIDFNSGRMQDAYVNLKAIPREVSNLRKSKFEQVIFTALADSVYRSLDPRLQTASLEKKVKDINWLRSLDLRAEKKHSGLVKELIEELKSRP